MRITGSIPPHILKLMPQDAKPKGAAGMMPEEAEQAGEVSLEVEHLHQPFIKWLEFHNLTYIYPRPDKKSGIRKGWPDFTVLYRGRACCIEFKRPGGKVGKDQIECRDHIVLCGTPHLFSYDVNTAIAFVKEALSFEPV